MKSLKWYAGKRVGKLVITGKSITKKPNYWICRCDCGETKNIPLTSLCRKNGASQSCGCLQREKASLLTRKEKGESGFNKLYKHYTNGAKSRNLCFNISKEYFKIITKMKCHYCGQEPLQICGNGNNSNSGYTESGKKHSEYIYNGIDRLDSSVGYTVDNCVACCGRCNEGKMELSVKDFLHWINNVYLHSIENRPHGKS